MSGIRARVAGAALIASTIVAVCSAPYADAASARIDWTTGGVPHVRASSWHGLGIGHGYAFATNNLCSLAEAFVTVNGERSRWFGPDRSYVTGGNGSEHNNLASDFFYGYVAETGVIEASLDQRPPLGPSKRMRELVAGYAAGYNRYLKKVGVDGVPDPACRGEPWVRPISAHDVWLRAYQLAILGSSDVFIDAIAAAEPPQGIRPPLVAREQAGASIRRALDLGRLGSNAIGLGREATHNGRGMLLGNPHFPWSGTERFHQVQLTIPGELDVAGASLYGMPMVGIGHTEGLAWSHTVSTAYRFTPYELSLVPGDPTAYFYDGQVERMEAVPVEVEVLGSSGGLESRSHTFYVSRFGPMVEYPDALMTWNSLKGYALRDANADRLRIFDQFLAMNQAQSVRELKAAQERWQAVPWVNTIAADRRGNAYYADASVVPNVPDEQVDRCVNGLVGTLVLAEAGLPILDGSRADCEWQTDPDAVVPGIIGPAGLPRLDREDYVQNSNDSYWLTNPEQPLEGYPAIIGEERTEQDLRTRLGISTIEARLAGSDGLPGRRFTPGQLRRFLLSDPNLSAELAREDLVSACEADPTAEVAGQEVDVSEACRVLDRWDGHAGTDSRGEALWQEFWYRASDAANLFTVPFDPTDPVNTPNTLNTAEPAILGALGGAVQELEQRGIALDARWGSVQRAPQAPIPIPGCDYVEGCYQAIYSEPGNRADRKQVVDGSSWIQVVWFTKRGPRARTIVTYSQSANRSSPHAADQTKRFSEDRFLRDRFTPAQIRSDPNLHTDRLPVG